MNAFNQSGQTVGIQVNSGMTAQELLATLRTQREYMVQMWIRLGHGKISEAGRIKLAGYDQAIIDAEEAIRDAGSIR